MKFRDMWVPARDRESMRIVSCLVRMNEIMSKRPVPLWLDVVAGGSMILIWLLFVVAFAAAGAWGLMILSVFFLHVYVFTIGHEHGTRSDARYEFEKWSAFERDYYEGAACFAEPNRGDNG